MKPPNSFGWQTPARPLCIEACLSRAARSNYSLFFALGCVRSIQQIKVQTSMVCWMLIEPVQLAFENIGPADVQRSEEFLPDVPIKKLPTL